MLRYGLLPRRYFTEGVQAWAERNNAFWVIDTIFIRQPEENDPEGWMQVWKVIPDPEKGEVVFEVSDGNGNHIITFSERAWDIPSEPVEMWLYGYSTENGYITLMLPEEY